MSFTSPPKKRKQTTDAPSETASKKHRKEGAAKKENKKKDKGKGRETEFQVVKASLVVSIPPIFTSDPRAGVEEMLDSMVMRYIPALRGVVLSHSNLTFIQDTATILADCPFLVCNVEFDATVWSPIVGMKLVGRIILCSPDHISLLLQRTFNVSIPRHHIPVDEWEFEYGPAENDPEFGADAPEDDENPGDDKQQNGGSSGKWIHRVTGDKLGGEDGYLEFTVVGLTVANEMLSLTGSLQVDPFSPAHVPAPAKEPEALSDEEFVEEPEVPEDVELDEEDEEEEEGDESSDDLPETVMITANAKRKAEEEEEKENLEKKAKKSKRKKT